MSDAIDNPDDDEDFTAATLTQAIENQLEAQSPPAARPRLKTLEASLLCPAPYSSTGTS